MSRFQTLNERQREELSTCMESCRNLFYPTAGLIEETAEYLQKLKYLIKWNDDLPKAERDHLEMLFDGIITIGLAVGKYAKMHRHDGNIPIPFSLKPVDTYEFQHIAVERIEGLIKEVGDIKWMTDAIDFYIRYDDGTDPTYAHIDMTAQDTADLNFNKLSHRKSSNKIDGAGDDR